MSDAKKTSTWLFNPHIYIAGWPALLIGIIAILLAGYLGSLSNTYFDGVLDIHIGRPAPLWIFLSAGLINWLCMSIACVLLGKMAAKKSFRLIDVFGTQALSRWPSFFATLVTLHPGTSRFSKILIQLSRTQQLPEGFNPIDAAVFGIATLVMLLSVAWMIRLMYKGFQTACDPKKEHSIRNFIVAIILAEIASKVAIVALMK